MVVAAVDVVAALSFLDEPVSEDEPSAFVAHSGSSPSLHSAAMMPATVVDLPGRTVFGSLYSGANFATGTSPLNFGDSPVTVPLSCATRRTCGWL